MDGDPGEEGSDALRRRLYRPAASDEDVRRYLAARPADEPAAAEPAAAPAPRRSGRRLLLALPLALVAATALTLAVRGGPAPAASPSPVSRASTVPPGQVVVPDDPGGSVNGPPVTVGLTIDGIAAVGQQFTGRGSRELPLDPGSAVGQSGRISVVLSSSTAVAWRAVRGGRTIASGGPNQQPGIARPVTVTYRDGAPTAIRVVSASDAVWQLLVAFAPATPADLR